MKLLSKIIALFEKEILVYIVNYDKNKKFYSVLSVDT